MAPRAAILGPFKRFAEIPKFPVVSKLRSAHPVGSFAGVVRVDEGAQGYGKRGRGPFAPGALVIEGLSADPDEPASLYYAMEKREAGYFPVGGDWEYSVFLPDGTLQAQGKLALCARCHAEAPHDSLFEYTAGAPAAATQ